MSDPKKAPEKQEKNNQPLNDGELEEVAGGAGTRGRFYCIACQKWFPELMHDQHMLEHEQEEKDGLGFI